MKKWEKPEVQDLWALYRPDGSFVGDDGKTPFLYASKGEAEEAGWNFPTNPCRAIRVQVVPK